MGCCSDIAAKLKSLPNPHALLYVTAKVIGGISIGILLATWLPIWTWWIFLVTACVVAIPVIWKIFRK